MGKNIYGSGTEEKCVVWLTKAAHTRPLYYIEEKISATSVFTLD